RSSHVSPPRVASSSCSFFFNDTPTTEIYTLSLHDALPISSYLARCSEPMLPTTASPVLRPMPISKRGWPRSGWTRLISAMARCIDRKSTRLNSSHDQISYAVFCLKKKKKTNAGNSHHTHQP